MDEPRELTLRGDLCQEVGASERGDRFGPMEHEEHSNAIAFETIRQTRPSIEDCPERGRAAPGAVADDGEAALAVDLTRLSGHKPADFEAGSSTRCALVRHIGFDPRCDPHLDGRPGDEEDRRHRTSGEPVRIEDHEDPEPDEPEESEEGDLGIRDRTDRRPVVSTMASSDRIRAATATTPPATSSSVRLGRIGRGCDSASCVTRRLPRPRPPDDPWLAPRPGRRRRANRAR